MAARRHFENWVQTLETAVFLRISSLLPPPPPTKWSTKILVEIEFDCSRFVKV